MGFLTGVWIWHIVAGILGVLFSLSIVYQRLERRFSVHQLLKTGDIEKIISDMGKELTEAEKDEFVRSFNDMIFMGKLATPTADIRHGTMIYMQSGERIQMALGQRFYEVRRVTRRGKQHHYGLMDRHMDQTADTMFTKSSSAHTTQSSTVAAQPHS